MTFLLFTQVIIMFFDGLINSEMSSGVNRSRNYIWNIHPETDCLGEGAFGRVFLGFNKSSGNKVAVKTFKGVVDNVLHQESNILKSFKHQYIIQLLDIEEEQSSNNKVMIMEYCNGGSLMDYLSEPENTRGLEDTEFLLVFEHLSAGLEYLRKHNVIHRDVKPGNIMRHIYEDGRVVFKLTDFGTARELPEGQNFQSLHGTEAYLNPQILQAYTQNGVKKFGANTDLWSIGVTLYQTATGRLPFRVFQKRLLPGIYEAMRRQEGVISAIQRSENSNDVLYYKTLPKTCRLSTGLKQLITPIIIGLFIQQKEKQWSFMEYNHNVLEILSRKMINVFYVNKMQLIKIYVKPDEAFSDLRSYVCDETHVSEDRQVFMYKNKLLLSGYNENIPINESESLFMFDKCNPELHSVQRTWDFSTNVTEFTSKFLYGECDDFSFVRTVYQELLNCFEVMRAQSLAYQHFDLFTKSCIEYFRSEHKEQSKFYDFLLSKCSSFNNRVKILRKLEDMNNVPHHPFSEKFKSTTQTFMSEGTKLLQSLLTFTTEIAPNTCHNSYVKTVEKDLAELKNHAIKFSSFKAYKKLYECEKIEMVRCVRSVIEISEKTEPDFTDFTQNASLWYSDLFAQIYHLTLLRQTLSGYSFDLRKFEQQIEYRSIESIKSAAKMKQIAEHAKKLQGMLSAYKRESVDVLTLLNENAKLVNAMNELTWKIAF